MPQGTLMHPLRNNAAIHFSFISNYVSPSVLIDPAETARNKRIASNWSNSQGGFLNPAFLNNALSYMLGCHTTVAEAKSILTADRHVQFGGFSGCSYGFDQVMRLDARPFRGWTNGPHGFAGNLLLNDGRVEYASQTRLQQAVTTGDDVGAGASEHFLTPF